jgi:hypothetical protein
MRKNKTNKQKKVNKIKNDLCHFCEKEIKTGQPCYQKTLFGIALQAYVHIKCLP